MQKKTPKLILGGFFSILQLPLKHSHGPPRGHKPHVEYFSWSPYSCVHRSNTVLCADVTGRVNSSSVCGMSRGSGRSCCFVLCSVVFQANPLNENTIILFCVRATGRTLYLHTATLVNDSRGVLPNWLFYTLCRAVIRWWITARRTAVMDCAHGVLQHLCL